MISSFFILGPNDDLDEKIAEITTEHKVNNDGSEVELEITEKTTEGCTVGCTMYYYRLTITNNDE